MNHQIDYITEYYIQRGKLLFWRCMAAGLFVTLVIILCIV